MKKLLLHLTIVIITIMAVFLACSPDPIKTSKSDNPEIKYEYMFTIKEENARVYRFITGLTERYVVIQGCGDVQVIWEQQAGKTTYPDSVQTMQKK